MAPSQGWTEEAVTNFTRALRLNPADAAGHYYLGGALDSAGRVAEPQQQFAEALRLDPEHAGAHLGLGITLREQGREAEALAQFAEAARLNPKLLEARLYLGIALLKQQKTPKRAASSRLCCRSIPITRVLRQNARFWALLNSSLNSVARLGKRWAGIHCGCMSPTTRLWCS